MLVLCAASDTRNQICYTHDNTAYMKYYRQNSRIPHARYHACDIPNGNV